MRPNRQGLRKLAPDLVAKAREDTATQVNRNLLAFVGTAAFCLLSLLTPDSALLAGSEKLNVPFAGPVSFYGFIPLGSAILILLRVYLQIYVEHQARLDRIAHGMPVAARAPTLIPLRNSLIRAFSGLTFYLLLPVTLLMFWKAAVFPAWGSGLLCIALAITAIHLMLPIPRLSWRSKISVGVSVAIFVSGITIAFQPVRRPFNLFHASLSNQYLSGMDLRDADLNAANLSGANLSGADLQRADLSSADLMGADVSGADLSHAKLSGANLQQTKLSYATLSGANLSGASLFLAKLSHAYLDDAKLSNADLREADLSSAYLRGASLSHANLRSADLSDAQLPSDLAAVDFTQANLSGADLKEANLSGVDLKNALLASANLSYASLWGASLSGADLSYAKLTETDLRNVTLRSAKLGSVDGLTQQQLDEACGDEKTELPPGLKLRVC